MNILSNLVMKSSTIVMDDAVDFPSNPSIGQFCFTGGILYIYATLKGVSTWYPLTNKSIYYVHTQSLSSITWTVEHNLGSKDLIVMVYDENDTVQLAAELQFTDNNTLQIGLTELTRGRVVVFAATDEFGPGGSASDSGLIAIAGTATNVSMILSTASASATLYFDECIVKTTLAGISYVVSGVAGLPVNVSTVGAGGMDTGQAPVSGFVGIYVIYNPTTESVALLATNATAAKVNTVYSGVNMPEGYTASALISVWPTSATRTLAVGHQRNRKFQMYGSPCVLSNGAATAWASINMATYIPKNAISVSGTLGYANSVSATGNMFLSAVNQSVGVVWVASASSSSQAPFNIYLQIVQTLYYYCTSANLKAWLWISGYEF